MRRITVLLAVLGLVTVLGAAPAMAVAVRVAAAGDIAQDPDDTGNAGYGRQSLTAAEVDSFIGTGDFAFPLGDIQYFNGAGPDYKCGNNDKQDEFVSGPSQNGGACGSYHTNEGNNDPGDDWIHAWGDFLSQTKPVPGNHDWASLTNVDGGGGTNSLAGYFQYFGQANVTTNNNPNKTWYKSTLGTEDWTAYFIDSVICTADDACHDTDPQYEWLEAQLASEPECTILVMHTPRWKSPSTGTDNGDMEDIYNLFDTDGQGDLVLSGSTHWYERWNPTSADGTSHATNNPIQFVVGAGGQADSNSGGWDTNSVAHKAQGVNGVLELKLWDNNNGPGSSGSDYEWKYITTDDGDTGTSPPTYTDPSGTDWGGGTGRTDGDCR